MDPIEALRSAIAKNKKLERKDGSVVIGMHAFPAKTVTCMKKLQAYEKKESVKETSYYTLDCLLFFWEVFSKNESLDLASYALQCADNGVDAVSFPQKDALLNYLKGKESSCIYFDTSASFRYVKPQYEGATSAGTENGDGAASSGAKTIQNYKRMRAILGNEKIYETRSKVITVDGRSDFLEAVRTTVGIEP